MANNEVSISLIVREKPRILFGMAVPFLSKFSVEGSYEYSNGTGTSFDSHEHPFNCVNMLMNYSKRNGLDLPAGPIHVNLGLRVVSRTMGPTIECMLEEHAKSKKVPITFTYN